jgi:hypothetical protein
LNYKAIKVRRLKRLKTKSERQIPCYGYQEECPVSPGPKFTANLIFHALMKNIPPPYFFKESL